MTDIDGGVYNDIIRILTSHNYKVFEQPMNKLDDKEITFTLSDITLPVIETGSYRAKVEYKLVYHVTEPLKVIAEIFQIMQYITDEVTTSSGVTFIKPQIMATGELYHITHFVQFPVYVNLNK